MTRHATAGAFVFCRFADSRWRLGLIEHPRLGRWMVPGGHVEDDECQATAALREVEEESGLTGVRLLEAPAPALPTGFPSTHARVPLPWWIIQQQVPADNHLPEGHVHVDHQYVALVDDPEPVRAPAHPFAWYRPHELSELSDLRNPGVAGEAPSTTPARLHAAPPGNPRCGRRMRVQVLPLGYRAACPVCQAAARTQERGQSNMPA
ncbi:MAG: NUDIX domain-containing protein [Actinobacteria bacterium]|nr:MAG: NUDIX domain-containing protein [Actinomycetota bacterium]